MKMLSETEVRVLGSLIEKQHSTPEYYPLTLNALVRACNQTTNRDPVVSYDEQTVMDALDALRARRYVYVFYGSDSRVPKYKQMMSDILELAVPELAIMCVLMLKGAQTIGEIRAGSHRLYAFTEQAEINASLDTLAAHDDPPLVLKLPRRAGQKEARYIQLLSEQEVEVQNDVVELSLPARASSDRAEDERVIALESEVKTLRGELNDLRSEFEKFKRQFE
jgi:uncharacterized protein YceH (UPF0502 family)